MGQTNYFSGIVKILENPKEKRLSQKISVTTFRAELPQFRKNRLISLMFWGNLGREINNYYQVNDYILIEGYVSIRNNDKKNLILKQSKKITITVLKVYPFLLQSNRIINKNET